MPFTILQTFLIIFALTIVLLVSELQHRAITAVLAATLTIYFGVSYELFTFQEAFHFIEFETVLLILSIFILVQTLANTGFFDFLSLSLVKLIGRESKRVTILMLLLTFIFTLFMTSTISIVVVASITALLHKRINIDFKRTLLLEGAVANTAGLALSISSIPNIIIKTRVGLAFTDFLIYTLPLSLVLLGVVYFHTSRTVEDRTIEEIEIDPWDVIPNRSALYRSLAIFSAFLVLIATSGFLEISPIFIAMSLALAMFFLSSVDPDAVFKRINWSVIFFVGAFYIFIRGLELSGVLSLVSESVSVLVVPNAIAAAIVIMWICAVVSALVDNIPVMLLLIPVVDQIVATMGLDPTPLYWALVIGGNLGGNITAFGSPAMLVSTETARKAGAEVGFAEFSRTVLPLTILLLLISSGYLAGLIAFNIL